MLTIYQSNLTEQLLAWLAGVLQRRPAGMPLLMPESVLVQNADMAQWLKMELADAHGVAANIEFPMPSTFLWQVFKTLSSDPLPDDSPFSKARMTWQLMRLLPEYRDEHGFAWVGRYLASEGAGEQYALYQLCLSIADLFDQYLMYRPDWIAGWESGQVGDEVPDEQRWQPVLWQALSQAIADSAGSRLHRSRLLAQIIDLLNTKATGAITGLPPRFCLFGISNLPEQTVLLMNALAKHTDVHWFQMNPCREFWLDIIDPKTRAKLAANPRYIHLEDLEEDRYFLVGNPLLAAMGTLGREHLSLMYEQMAGDSLEEYLDFPTKGALGALQTEIHQLQCRGQFESLTTDQLSSNKDKLSFSPDGLGNMQFHGCYSPMREVEALKDCLLGLFESDPQLTPNDVLVMMPDVGAYAPAIHAVFGGHAGTGSEAETAHQRKTDFFYSINDLSAVQESPLLDSLLTLFDLPDSRVMISEVISILEVPAVMARFALEADELDQIKYWLNGVGVRWGRDGAHRQAMGLGAFEQNTWQFGLRRMLAGYAMHPGQGVWQDTLPYLEIEGARAAALGKLLMFMDSLDQYRSLLSGSHTAEGWSGVMAQLVADFYQPDDDEMVMLQRGTELVAEIARDCEAAGYDQVVSRPIIREQLAQGLNRALAGRRFRAGAVNFCTLMPMRSIPFKVICLLGMNEGEFPRNAPAVSFDLMTRQRRRGDRSRRLDDRYLFLEALLSCRQHLHISWVARSIRDDSVLPPSLLVSELLDYIDDAWVLETCQGMSVDEASGAMRKELITWHPLQPFNPKYFTPGSSLQSFAGQWLENLQAKGEAGTFGQSPLPLSGELTTGTIELGHLEAMLINPCKAFMQRRLGIYLDSLEKDGSDSEPFELDALAIWQLKDEALRHALGKQSMTSFVEHHCHSGLLPVGEAGRLALTRAQEASESLLAHLPNLLPQNEAPVEVRALVHLENDMLAGIPGGEYILGGSVPQPHNGYLVYVKTGAIKPRDRMRCWLRHLLGCGAGLEVDTLLLDSTEGICFPRLSANEAGLLLGDYIAAYLEGMTRPLALFINSVFIVADARDKPVEERRKRVLDKWQPSQWNQGADGGDPYISRCYPSPEPVPVWQELSRWSDRLVLPLCEGQTAKMKHERLVAWLEEQA